MKTHYLLTAFAVICLSGILKAQTSDRKNAFFIGGGTERYNGDLGNAWFDPEEEWYGQLTLGYTRYFNRSLDASLILTHGDYGHCREDDEPVFRPDGSEVLNMLSRLSTAIFSVRYKLTGTGLIKEHAKFVPYVFAGIGFDNISNAFWTNKSRVFPANTGSVNTGFGAIWNFSGNYQISYQMGFGRLFTDAVDGRVSGSNDMYMQQSICLGYCFR